jgi:hypothetical protein
METVNNWNDITFRSKYMKNYCANYYQEKKELLSTKVKCDCGRVVSLSSLKRHKETPYHKNHLLSKDEQVQYMKTKVLNS